MSVTGQDRHAEQKTLRRHPFILENDWIRGAGSTDFA